MYPECLEYVSLCYSGFIPLVPYGNLVTIILDQTFGVSSEEFRVFKHLKHLDVNMCM